MLIFGYILIGMLILTLLYMMYNQQKVTTDEGFYPRRWGWRRPWFHGWGNWRPYGYYPAYSGYWKQCRSGTWCPQTLSCSSPACQ